MNNPSGVDPDLATYLAGPDRTSDARQVRAALDAAVTTNARPMSLGLGLLYVLLTGMHALLQPSPVRTPMLVIALGSSLGLLSLHLFLRRRPIVPRWGNWIGASMVLVVLLNSLAHLALAENIKLTSNISILLIGIGAYFLRRRWFIGLSAMTLTGWWLVIMGLPPQEDPVHYIVWKVESVLVATVLFMTRSHLLRRLARLHLQDERQKAELAEATRVAEQNREAAEVASRAKSAFLANMSHEMRTPLTAILGYNDLLQLQLQDNPQLVSDVQQIRQAGMHLLALIDDVLDLSKIEAGRITLHLETFSIHKLIDEIVTTSRPLIMQNDNTLQVQIDQAVTLIHADRTRLQQILLNLINNAAKFTEQGTITLRVWMEPSVPGANGHGAQDEPAFIVFQVCDTGIGVDPEQVERLFVAFQQGDAAHTHQYGGAGLGLALSRRLCRLMGGDITGTGEPGRGATFTVRIPVQVTSSQVDRPRPAPE